MEPGVSRDEAAVVLSDASLTEKIVRIFPELVGYARDFRAMCDGPRDNGMRKPRVGLAHACIDEAGELLEYAQALCRTAMALREEHLKARVPVAGRLALDEYDEAGLPALRLILGVYGVTASVQYEAVSHMGDALRQCTARALREAARVGREEEIMVPIPGEGASEETKRAWGIRVVEALCKMLEARAAKIDGGVRP